MALSVNEQNKLFNQIQKATDDLYHDLAEGAGLSETAYWIIYVLLEQAPHIPSQKEICETFSFSKQTVNSALKRLQAEGLISLSGEDAPGRRKGIRLTEKGQKFAAEKVEPVIQAELNALRAFSPEDRELLLRLTQKYHEQFKTEAETIIRNGTTLWNSKQNKTNKAN